jgi:hypothetical protein
MEVTTERHLPQGVEGERAGASAAVPACPNFAPLSGGAPGKAGLMVGVNLHAIDMVYGCWDERIGQSVLRLLMSSGRTIQVTGEDEIEEFLDLLGLGGCRYRLDLEQDLD